MINNIYPRIAKYKAEIVMGLKILVIVSFLLVSLIILPQIFSQEQKAEIISFNCIDISLEEYPKPYNLLERDFYGQENIEHPCHLEFGITNLNKNISRFRIMFLQKNGSLYRFLTFNSTQINDLENNNRIDVGFTLPRWNANGYTGNITFVIDNSESITGQTFSFILRPIAKYWGIRNIQAITELTKKQSESYNITINIQKEVAQIEADAYFWGIMGVALVTIIVSSVFSYLEQRKSKKELIGIIKMTYKDKND